MNKIPSHILYAIQSLQLIVKIVLLNWNITHYMSYECCIVWIFKSLGPTIIHEFNKTVKFSLCGPHFLEVKIPSYIILNGLSFYRLNCVFEGMIDIYIANALCIFKDILSRIQNSLLYYTVYPVLLLLRVIIK